MVCVICSVQVECGDEMRFMLIFNTCDFRNTTDLEAPHFEEMA